MKRPYTVRAVAALGALLPAAALAAMQPNEPEVPKVLLIGIDGCRFDALRAAATPNLDELVEHGGVAQRIRIFPSHYREADTVSGPGWSSILTGVWADKHGVLDNDFAAPRYDRHPHFFALIKKVRPAAYTASLADWEPIQATITSAADMNPRFPLDPALDGPGQYIAADADATATAVKLLTEADPTAVFVYFGQVDEIGHDVGFSPSVPQYIAAIERVDKHVGELIEAIAGRRTGSRENWLILVTTDHGGRGTHHRRGHDDPEVACSFLIVSGPSAQRGLITQECGLVDVVPTALAHLAINIDAAWKLDGRPVGLRLQESSSR